MRGAMWAGLLAVIWWGWCLALPAVAAPGVSAPASADSAASSAAPSKSWLSRNLERYFGGENQQAEDLAGEALGIVDTYVEHAGKTIEVVIVHQVAGFGEAWDTDHSATQRLLTGVTGSFRSNTRDNVIRSYLLFRRGDHLDPYALADSEVMLRRLPYINDVRLTVVPLAQDGQSVAVVVETTDRWPLGVDGQVTRAEEFSAKLYSENVAGYGVNFSNEILHNSLADPVWGYSGRLRKENIAGTFIAADVVYENSYRRHARKAQAERLLSHPGLHGVGGISFEHTDDYESYQQPNRFEHIDLWLGDVVRLRRERGAGPGKRPVLVPALRYFRTGYLDRPTVDPDTNRSFHEQKALLAGLTFRRLKDYKSSYVFGDGEIEVLPVGAAIRLSTGYEWREFETRTPVFLETALTSVRHRGDVLFFNLGLGGHIRNRRMEDGVFKIGAAYLTPLWDAGRRSYRFYSRLEYTEGLNRHPDDHIFLGGRTGIRELPNNAVRGNQRLVGTLAARLFTDWAVLGFRFSFYAFADAGLMGQEDAAAFFAQKIHVSTGLGARLRNPSLVLPTVQVQLSFLTNPDTPGMSLAFKVGRTSTPSLDMPGVRPVLPEYN